MHAGWQTYLKNIYKTNMPQRHTLTQRVIYICEWIITTMHLFLQVFDVWRPHNGGEHHDIYWNSLEITRLSQWHTLTVCMFLYLFTNLNNFDINTMQCFPVLITLRHAHTHTHTGGAALCSSKVMSGASSPKIKNDRSFNCNVMNKYTQANTMSCISCSHLCDDKSFTPADDIHQASLVSLPLLTCCICDTPLLQ